MRVVRLFREGDRFAEDRSHYVAFAVKVLKVRGADLAWLPGEDGELWACLVAGASREEAGEALKRGEFEDFSPTQERLALFSAYSSMISGLARLREAIARLSREVDDVAREALAAV